MATANEIDNVGIRIYIILDLQNLFPNLNFLGHLGAQKYANGPLMLQYLFLVLEL